MASSFLVMDISSFLNFRSLQEKVVDYFKEDFTHDLIAGIIVGLVALPLAIAFGIASGATAEQGLYTAIIAGAIIALFSGSVYQVSGPTGAFIVILLGIVNDYGMQSLLIAGFLAGIILIIMGVFKFGAVIKYIPYPVIVGFTAGIGTIIFSGQIKDFLGLTLEHRPHGFIETLQQLYYGMEHGINFYAFLVGAVTLLVFFLWKKYYKFPAAPIALLAGTLVSLFFSDKIPTVGTIPHGFPSFAFLPFDLATLPTLLAPAFTIAMLCAIESLLSAVVADGMTGTKHNSNKELISQGIGNMIVPFFGGIPATGAIARTATNIKNGARTRVAALIHAFVLLLIVLLFADYAQYIPMAALAAILMTVAYMMSEVPHFVRLFSAPLPDVAVLLATYFLTVFVDLTIAVGVGVVLAALLFIKRVSEVPITSLEESAKIGSEGSKMLHESVKDIPGLVLYDINGPLFFGAASFIQERIPHKKNEILILRMKYVHVIDATALHALELLIHRAHKNGGKIFLATVQPKVHEALENHGVIELLGGEHYLPPTSTEAIVRAKKILKGA